MSDLFTRHPRLLILTLLLSVVAGSAAWLQLPRLEDPNLVPRFAMVYTPYPGATAKHVEARVTDPLEDSLRKFQELKTLASTSRMGMSVLTLELADWINPEQIAPIWSKIKDEIEQASQTFPAGVGRPDFVDEESQAYTLIVGLHWQQSTNPPPASLLRRLSDELQHQLRAVPGTEYVRQFGAPQEEILVELDNLRLSSLNLSIQDVAREIYAADAKTPAGLVRNPGINIPIEVEGDPADLAAIANLAIADGKNGAVIRLGDIATIQQSQRQPMAEQVLLNGNPGVAVAVRMDSHQRIDQWQDRVDQRMAQFKETLPHGLEFQTIFAQSKYVDARFAELGSNFLLATLLVLVVSFLMLGWRAAILVGITLPLTSLLVLAGMKLMGVPLHQISVSGMIIALGMLIDNAIIMVDEIRGRLAAKDEGVISVVRHSVRFLAVPLFGSTLTTVLAFSPLLLMQGPTGEFVGSIAITVSLALASSLFLSLTVLPALAAHSNPNVGGGLQFPRLSNKFSLALAWLFKRPKTAIVMASLPAILGFYAATGLTEQFFPPAERDQFQIQLILPRQASLQQTRETVEEANKTLHQHASVDQVHWFIGTSAPQFYYNMMTGQAGANNFAQALVQLKDGDDLARRIQGIQADLDQAVPQATTLALQLEQGPPFAAPIEMRLFGPNLDQLQQSGEELRHLLAEIPDVTHSSSSLQNGQLKLWLRNQNEDARLAGFSRRDLAEQLQSSLEGVVAGSMMQETEELPIRVRLHQDDRNSLEELRSMELNSREFGNQPVPLEAIANFELIPEWAAIPHRGGERMTSVFGYLQAGKLPAETLAALRQKMEQSGFQLPPGIRLEFGGEAAERDGAVGSLLANVGILATLMLAVLVLSFSSFRAAAIIGVVAILAAGSGLAALSLAGYPFGFMAILGILGLVGLAINDSIVVLAALRADPEASSGHANAVRRVVMHASRHVFTTTVTTVAGFMPLILGGSLFWAPLAVVIAGGVVGATMFALVFIPASHLLLSQKICAQPDVKNSSVICTPLNKLWQTMQGSKFLPERR
jgi:multidrug efflux pump